MANEEMGMILDVTPGDYESFERHLLEGTGHRVESCHGPASREGKCPMLEGETCTLIDEAHGVVFKLDLDRETHRRILEAYKRVLPDGAPIGVALQPGQEETYADLLSGVHVWTHQPTSSDLDGFAALVEAADYTRPDSPA
ncbi:MAG: hypothetical protein OER95_05050 [Acidimicrobiia bacterium]|nr:hypothetical protein [Acidimicrobiia bacterium]